MIRVVSATADDEDRIRLVMRKGKVLVLMSWETIAGLLKVARRQHQEDSD